MRLFAIDDALGTSVEIKNVQSFEVERSVNGPTTVKLELLADENSFVRLESAP